MDKIVSLCKRRGFIFQNSEIYGGQNGFWDYGPLGTELKRNVRENWYGDMVTNHDEMCGVETSLIMNPQVWKCSGHYDLFADMMVDCRECKSRYRADHVSVAAAIKDGQPVRCQSYIEELAAHGLSDNADLQPACPKCKGSLTEPRQFNLMLETNIGAIQSEKNRAFLRPETAQGMFVNFKNVIDSCRVKVPFGIAQVGKSFRNEITPRNFTFRSREFEQMEMEFFCHPDESQDWYKYWRDRRYAWYTNLGISKDNLILRDHTADEMAHYSVGTADVEYAFPFLADGEYGELEGIAHRGDFDLRSHMEGKLAHLTWFDAQSKERYVPHVIEPAAGADRATLAFICEAWCEDEQPDAKGVMQKREVMKFHPRLAPIKVGVFPLTKKDGQPEKAADVYRELKSAGIATTYEQQGAIGKRYRRQDEIGTPFCLTIDHETADNDTVTLRDRDTLEQVRIPVKEVVDEIARRLRA
ncbi:UNVERIFIED_CONTAM: hypothetical protein GTU68_012215 [Idotea baltica]|nr:hypothetical protein [Idotea baltica]